MDYDDVIPSSQSAESHVLPAANIANEPELPDRGSSSPLRKRKLEVIEVDNKPEGTNNKLPRIKAEDSGIPILVTTNEEKREESSKPSEVCASVLSTKNPTKVTISEKEVEIVSPKKDTTVKDITPSSSTKRNITFDDSSRSDSLKSDGGTIVSESSEVNDKITARLAKTVNVDKIEQDKSSGKSRESVQIVFMSPSVKSSMKEKKKSSEQVRSIKIIEEIANMETQEEDVSYSQEEDFHLRLSVSANDLDCTIEEIQENEKYDTQQSKYSKNTSERSESCNSHADDDDEIKLLPSVETKKLQTSTDSTIERSSSSQHLDTSSSSNVITVSDDDESSEDKLKEITISAKPKSIKTLKNTIPEAHSVSTNAVGRKSANTDKPRLPPSSLGIKGTAFKRKHDALKDNDVIHVPGSDCEEDQLQPDVRKKPKETNNTPDILAHSETIIKEKYVSTPLDGHIKILGNESISSIEMESLKEHTPQIVENHTPIQKDDCSDINGQAVERERKIYLECKVKVKSTEQTQEIVSWEVAQWEDITDDLVHSPTHLSDLSPGALADVSKNTSPASTASFGPFPLQSHKLTRVSTSSSSSAGISTSGSSVYRSSSLIGSGIFAAPSKPVARILRDKFSSSENISGKCSFTQVAQQIFLKEFELIEKIEKRIQHDIHCDGVPFLSLRNKSVQEENEKRSVMWKSKSASTFPIEEKREVKTKKESGMDRKELSESESKNNKEVPIDSTPKSTKKSLIRSSRATRTAARGNSVKAIQETRGDVIEEQDDGDQIPENGSRNGTQKKVRRTPMRSNASSKKADIASEGTKPASAPSSRPRRGRNDKSERNNGSDAAVSPKTGKITSNWGVECCRSKLVPDGPAFARWADKKYYSAKIKEKAKDDRWVIQFDDGNVKTMKEEFIIPVNILTKGQIVFALVEDEYEEGVITEFKVENEEVHYGVEIGGGEIVFVPRRNLYMTEDQARILQEDVVSKTAPTTPKSTSVSIDNIVQGRRSRTNRGLFRTMDSPGVSGIARLTPKRLSKSDPFHDTSGSSSVSDGTDRGSSIALDEVGGVDPELHTTPEYLFALKSRGKGPGRIKGKGRSTPRKAPSLEPVTEAENPELIESLGPIPPIGSEIFSGMHFLLTYAGFKAPSESSSEQQPAPTLSSETEEKSEDCYKDRIFSKYAYVKDHLKQQLEAGGGQVYEHFDDVPIQHYPHCYLIADRPTLTAKYILCLANGIKIIMHDWVISKSKGLAAQLQGCRLSAGWSLENRHYIDDDTRSRKRKPLNKKEVGLVHDSKRFIKFWDQVLVTLGAKVIQISPEEDKEFSTVNVIVSDSSCPPEIQERAREWSIPLVSTVWVKQCLIMWEARPYDGHSHYRYDYCSSD